MFTALVHNGCAEVVQSECAGKSPDARVDAAVRQRCYESNETRQGVPGVGNDAVETRESVAGG
jgi:hypothetical protein